MPTLVFLSHSSKDDDTVTRIHDAIEAATKEKVWVDHKDIEVGDHWQPLIDTTLATCTHMVVIISKHSMGEEKDATDEKARGSREVEAEWRDALLRNKPLLPVIIDDIKLEDIPARLRIIQPVNLKLDWDGGIRQLVDVIGRVHKGVSIATDFGRWSVTGSIDRMLTSIPISGRETEIAKVQDDLKRAPTSILGVGGLGKSRLAAEIVLTQGETSGAIWHVCSEYSTAEDVYELLRERFGFDAATPAKEVLKRLRTERLLVVLDNAESVGENDPQRNDYIKLVNDLYGTQSTQVLLTSRTEWTDIRAGRVLRLNEPKAAAAEQIVRDMAMAFDITDYKSDDYAAELAEAARYHPRLIEWAVGKLAIDEPEVVIRELRELKSEDIQDALNEMIQKTIEQMMAEERDGEEAAQTLAKWSVCRGGFTREAAGYLQQEQERKLGAQNYVNAKEPMTLLDEDQLSRALKMLMRWQFVRRTVTEKGQTRYTIEAIVSTVTAADETAQADHFDYYLFLAERHNKRQDYAGLAVEMDNLEAAFEWAMGMDNGEKALNLANESSDFLYNQGRYKQILEWDERIVTKLVDHADKSLWANAQNSLGADLQNMPIGNRYENLKRAVAAYEAALVYRTAEAASLDYAMTQNNLASVYCDLAQLEDREINLKRAVVAYEEALLYRTAETAPLAYAMTQNNLGTAYRDLAQIEDREANLKRAVAVYEEALLYRTAEVAPLDYAMTQNNLGVAYRSLSKVSNRKENLKRAMAAYMNALIYNTLGAAPLSYATTQRNLGNAYEDMGAFHESIHCWREAEIYYRQMGVIDRADLMLRWIADLEKRLGENENEEDI